MPLVASVHLCALICGKNGIKSGFQPCRAGIAGALVLGPLLHSALSLKQPIDTCA
jgi:hypothetical protein